MKASTGNARPAREIRTANQADFLRRCQVDTPQDVVALAWRIVSRYRRRVALVGDLGCGDARFSHSDRYERYIGFEIDPTRVAQRDPPNVHIEIGCAFDNALRHRFDLCIGNPPYVRHHVIDPGWRRKVGGLLAATVPYVADGRANAYIYFVWLALALTTKKGLVVLLLPSEWVTRPASARLRAYINSQQWNVDIFQLCDDTFDRVLTTSSICVINKARREGRWRSFDVGSASSEMWTNRPMRVGHRVLPYEQATNGEHAQRGLSPGHQKALLLTEGERLRFGLEIGLDVLAAVSSFKHLSETQLVLSEHLFRKAFVNRGRRCWLINPVGAPRQVLLDYLQQVPKTFRSTATCLRRDDWWRFQLPQIAQVLYSSGFVSHGPKAFYNEIRAVHVGGIHGIFCPSKYRALEVLKILRKRKFALMIMPLSKGFKKIEVRQMNAFLNRLDNGAAASR